MNNSMQLSLAGLLAIPLVIIGGVFSTDAASKKNSAGKGKYISQELIDTSIQRGFMLLNESADMAGVGFRHQRSITEAKKIVRSLRDKAKGDPNEKYVLWKVGELEAQIYLEESDLLIQEMRKRQLTINELVDKYNAEVGKWRPDFATLYRLHNSMGQVDQQKANELADSYNQRKRGISREVVHFLEKALLAGNLEEARKEVGYCLRNQLYLDISLSTYKQLENRVEGLLHAQAEKPQIDVQIVAARKLLDRKNLVGARKTIDSAENSFSTIKEYLPQREVIAMSSTFKRVKGRLGSIEDSLVDVNVGILHAKGVDAADKYLQTVLRPLGVGRDKTALVDRMIISVKSPEDNAMRSEIDGLASDEPDENPVLDNIMLAAKKKAQDKMDSLQAIENARLWQERREQARKDSIEEARQAALYAKQLQADSIAMAIYTRIEKNDLKAARKMLVKEDAYLRNYMRPEEFAMLHSTIEQFLKSEADKKNRVTYITPVEKQSSAPVPSKERQSAPRQAAAQSSQKTQQQVQPPARQQPVAAAPSLQENLERAQEEVLGIYSMLEQNDIDRAFRRFQINRNPLRKYLAPEAFSMLEMSVKQAYEFSKK